MRWNNKEEVSYQFSSVTSYLHLVYAFQIYM